MATALNCCFTLLYISAVLFCFCQPTVIRTSAPNVDDILKWTSKGPSDNNVGKDTLNTTLEVSPVSSDASDSGGMSKPVISVSDSLEESELTNWTNSEGSSSAIVDFHLSDSVGISDMNSSGEGSTGNIQDKLEDHSEEVLRTLGSFHLDMMDDGPVVHRNQTDLDDIRAANSLETALSVEISETDSLNDTGVFGITQLLIKSLSDDSESSNINKTMNQTPEDGNETYIEIHLNGAENASVPINISSDALNLRDQNDLKHVESPGIPGLVLNTTGKSDSVPVEDDNGTDIEIASVQGPNAPTLTSTFTLQTAGGKMEIEALQTPTDVGGTQESTVAASTVSEERPCPAPGICILWFLSRHSCQTNADCSGSRICCRVNCSRSCISIERS